MFLESFLSTMMTTISDFKTVLYFFKGVQYGLLTIPVTFNHTKEI